MLIAVAIVLALYFVLVGLYARLLVRRARFSVDPMVELWAPGGADAPPDTEEAYAEVEPQLAAIGFTAESGITLRHTTMELTVHLVCFRAPDVAAELCFNPGVPPKVIFWSPLENRNLVTAPLEPGASHLYVPSMDEVNVLPTMHASRLLALHRAACVSRGSVAMPLRLAEFIVERSRANMKALAKRGFFAEREHSFGYSAQASLKIAFCFLPPIRWLLGFVAKWLARRLQNELARINPPGSSAVFP